MIEASDWWAFKVLLEGQPIFYQVLNREYATQSSRAIGTRGMAVAKFDVQVVGWSARSRCVGESA